MTGDLGGELKSSSELAPPPVLILDMIPLNKQARNLLVLLAVEEFECSAQQRQRL